MRRTTVTLVAGLAALALAAPAAAYHGSYGGRFSGSSPGHYSGLNPGHFSGSYLGRGPSYHTGRPAGAYPGHFSGSYPGRGPGYHTGRPAGAYPGHFSGSYPGRGPGYHTGRPAGAYPGHYPSHYPGYYPGRYPGYYPYHGSYWGVGIGWGWGWGGWGWGGGWGPLGWGWGGPWGPWGWGATAEYQPVPGADAQPNLAAVSTDVSPEHARVILDGMLIGVADDFDGTPDYLYLRPGHYTIEFQLGGYRSEKLEIDASLGNFVPIKLKLERIQGEKATPWYDRPEGLPVGRIFGPKQAVQEAPARSGPDPALRPETREPARPAPGASRPSAGAALELRVTPANAAVYVDGTMVGTGQELGRLERGLAVSPGKHRIEVIAPGHASKSLDVEVKEGQRLQVVVELDGGAGQN